MQIKPFNNEQLASLIPEWRYWWPIVAVHLFLICKVSQKKKHIFKMDMLSLWHEGTMNSFENFYQFKTIVYLVD